MNQLLSIVDDKIVIEKLKLKYLDGNVLHAGFLEISGGLTVNQEVKLQQDLNVLGTITADSIHVKHLITDDARQLDAYTFNADSIRQLDGRGLLWGLGEDQYFQFVLKADPRRIYSSETIDLHADAKYQIDGIDVLLKDRLGSTITKSNLTKLGVLEALDVEGNTNLSNTVIVNGYLNKVGINTEKPNGTFSVLDNAVEFIVSSFENGQINVGTWASDTLNIVTDNTPRISIKGTTVTFGSEISKNATVKINGVLEVDSIVADTRVNRFSSLEFIEDAETGIYNKGISWIAQGQPAKQLSLLGNPNRIHSTESFSIASGKEFLIGKVPVLSSDALGSTIKFSNLEQVGTLQSLTVGGNVNLADSLFVNFGEIKTTASIVINKNDETLSISSNTVDASNSFKVKLNDQQELSLTQQNISLGNSANTTRVINAYGRLSINVTNPDHESALTVDGPVVMSGKKFVNGTSSPTSGNWNKGDIVWNINPIEGGFVGWVCVTGGAPGEWRPFGQIIAK